MERVVPQAVAYWEEVLTVVNPVDNIKLNRCRDHEYLIQDICMYITSLRVVRKCQDNQYFLSPGESTQYCKVSCVETKCGEYQVPCHGHTPGGHVGPSGAS